MINSKELALTQALAEMASTTPTCVSILTLPKLTEIVAEEEKLVDNILALLESGKMPSCAADSPTKAGTELPKIMEERLELLEKMHLDIDNKLQRVRDLVQALRMRIV